MAEKVRMAGQLLLACILMALPMHAQASSEPQTCPGSTVDLQGSEFAEKSRAFLSQLQAAVKRGDKAAVASLVSYPLAVIQGSTRRRIRSKAIFISQYDSIFDAHIRQAILQQSSQCLFGNDQGAMVGDGEAWFAERDGSMKIISINARTGK